MPAAYPRLSCPHPAIKKYTGTKVSSKNTKKTSRSRARKPPRHPASSTRIQATKDLSPALSAEAASAIGNKSAVINTKKSEMPSIPRLQEIPKAAIH